MNVLERVISKIINKIIKAKSKLTLMKRDFVISYSPTINLVEKKYIFICGCGHSGTSLLLSLFRNSNNCFSLKNETSFFRNPKNGTLKEFKEFIKIINKQQIPLTVEKTPKHVYYCAEILSEPDTEILIMIRNPFDVVSSLIKRGYNFDDALERYKSDNLAWQKFSTHERLIIIKYEDLVDKFEYVSEIINKRYKVNFHQANQRRLKKNEVYFDEHHKDKVYSKDNEGKGEFNHLLLRNFQMRQPIRNMNGKWIKLLSKDNKVKIKISLSDFIERFGYDNFYLD